jgi:DNA-binding winged helix-turn-helix (wHTH) protein
MSSQDKHFYEFGQFRVDTQERALWADGQPVYLPPKVFDTLLALVQRSGHVVAKDELMQMVWPETFVEESNLTQNISVLRRTLGDGRNEHRYIETIPRRGYRFAAGVREAWDNGDEIISATHTKVSLTIKEETEEMTEAAPPYRAHGGETSARRPFNSLALAATALVVTATGGVFLTLYRSPETKPPAPETRPAAAAQTPAKPFTIKTFDPSVWPREDAEIGVAGFVIEDFEDEKLVAGLRIELSDCTDNFGPTATLPLVFNPDIHDSGGARVFVVGLWDGAHLFINRRAPPPHGYADFQWGDVTFHLAGGATSFGFSLDDMDLNTELLVNGVSQANLRRLLPSGTIRSGYVRIDAAPGETIFTVKIANKANEKTGDGLAFDHVAFKPLAPTTP